MYTILVVDDEPIFRELIDATLRANGYTVLTATHGHEAAIALESNDINLLLLDLNMPVMDGIALLAFVRGSNKLKNIPAIVLSADSDRGRIVESAKYGIAGYLMKSHFSLRNLLERVKTALEATAEKSTAKPSGVHESVSNMHANPSRSEKSTPPHKAPAIAGKKLEDLKPALSRAGLLKQIESGGELKGFSPTVSQVLQITSNPRCSVDQVAKAINQDQAIALKILKLANSSVYSRGDRVGTIQKAVLRIGMERIRQTVLNIGVIERFSSVKFDRYLGAPQFWEHSIACGIIAAELAHALKHADPDTAFTAGLLHDLGKVILAEHLGETYLHVFESAAELKVPLEQAEQRLLSITHAEVMDTVLRSWRFPKELLDPVVLHHALPEKIRSRSPHQHAEVLRLALADRLAQAMVLGSGGNDTIYPTEEFCRALKIDAATIQVIVETARQQTDETKVALLAHSSAAVWPRRIEEHRAALAGPCNPIYFSAAPEFDAFRIAVDAMISTSEETPPNVVIVHATSAKELDLLAQLLAAAEEQRSVNNLPLLMLSPTGQLALKESVMASRVSRSLRTPVRVTEFIDSLNALVAPSASQQAA